MLTLKICSRIARQSSQRRASSTTSDPNEAELRNHVRELIESIRNQTGLSYNVAQATIHSVLSYVTTNFSRLDRNIPALMCELEHSSAELLKEPGDVAVSGDSKALEKLFEELTRCIPFPFWLQKWAFFLYSHSNLVTVQVQRRRPATQLDALRGRDENPQLAQPRLRPAAKCTQVRELARVETL